MNIQFSLCFSTGQQIIPPEMNFRLVNDFGSKMKSLLRRIIARVSVGCGGQGLTGGHRRAQQSQGAVGSTVQLWQQ